MTLRLPSEGDIIRGIGRVVKVVTPQPIQPPDVYIVDEKQFEIVVMSGKMKVDSGPTYNNLYRDTFASALEAAKDMARHPKWNIPQSGFHVELRETIQQSRYQSTPCHDRKHFWDERYQCLTPSSHYVSTEHDVTRVLWASNWPGGIDAEALPSPECRWWDDGRDDR